MKKRFGMLAACVLVATLVFTKVYDHPVVPLRAWCTNQGCVLMDPAWVPAFGI